MFIYQRQVVEKFEVEEEKVKGEPVILGEGSFGKVLSGIMTLTFKTGRVKKIGVAIKRIMIDKQKMYRINQLEYIKRELAIYKSVKSENMVQFYGDNLSEENKIDKINSIEFYLEKCDGNLCELIKQSQQECVVDLEIQALQYLRTIFNLIQILRQAEIQRSKQMTWYGVFHRDLNLNNVLYIRKRSGRIILKICDFGISHFKNMKGNNLSTFRKGTPNFMSPKNLENDTYDVEKNEVWSLGVLLFQMLFGENEYWRETFLSASAEKRLKEIKKQGLKISDATTELLINLLEPNEDKRWNFDQIQSCEAFQRLMTQYSSLKMTFLPRKLQNRQKQFKQLEDFFIQCPSIMEEMPKSFKKYIYYLFKVWGERQCQRYSGQYQQNLKSIGDQIMTIQEQLRQCDELIEEQNNLNVVKLPKPDDFWYYINKIEQIKAKKYFLIDEKQYLISKLEVKYLELQGPFQNNEKKKKAIQKQNKILNQIDELKVEIQSLLQQDQLKEVHKLKELFESFFYSTIGKKLQIYDQND